MPEPAAAQPDAPKSFLERSRYGKDLRFQDQGFRVWSRRLEIYTVGNFGLGVAMQVVRVCLFKAIREEPWRQGDLLV